MTTETSKVAALFKDKDAFQKAFSVAKKSKHFGEDLASGKLLKFDEEGEVKILLFTGKFKVINFPKGGPKKCPVFLDNERNVLPASDSVLISSFEDKEEGFYRIKFVENIITDNGTYRKFDMRPILPGEPKNIPAENAEDDLPF